MTDWFMIEAKTWRAFDCQPVVGESLLKPSRKDRVRIKKRNQVSIGVDRFRQVMDSPNPPQTRDEAVKSVIGSFGYFLAIIFPQYALLIQIITVAWELLQNMEA